MSAMPRDPAIDSTLALLREGYEFIWNRCRRLGSDLFATRLLGKRVICIHGKEAAALFSDSSKFERRGALPRRVITSLFGKRAVHTLDDEAHRQRKAAFMSLMSAGQLDEFLRESARQWQRAIARWPSAGEVSLFDEARRVLTVSACAWAGVPLATTEVECRSCDLARMIDAFGGLGPRLRRGKLARMRTERWMTRLVTAVRRGQIIPDPQSALAVMAQLPGDDGGLLDARTAAIEVINVIRPTVAIAWYIVFAALALNDYPVAADRLVSTPLIGSDGTVAEYADRFMQEVRRFYPFTPYLGAKVRAPFSWRGHAFEPGQLVLVDVYGTNHDPKIWDSPEDFRSERFAQWVDDRFELIPQDGGDRTTGHRCPGEWITMHEIALGLHFLTRCISYRLRSDQDLGFALARMPTRPRSGVVLCNVELERRDRRCRHLRDRGSGPLGFGSCCTTHEHREVCSRYSSDGEKKTVAVASILIVDDEFALADLVGEPLTLRGHKVKIAINGLLGITHLRSEEFDLVISDVMMPIMTGIEMVTTMREDARLASLPVILTSAQPLLLDTVQPGLVQAVLPKPYAPQALYAEVERLVGNA